MSTSVKVLECFFLLTTFYIFRPFISNVPAIFMYIFKCMYFGLSAYQVRWGYPTRILGNFLTKSYTLTSGILFQGWVLVSLVSCKASLGLSYNACVKITIASSLFSSAGKHFLNSQEACPFKSSFWLNILPNWPDIIHWLTTSWRTQDVLVRCSVIESDHNVKLVRYFENLVRRCLITEC